MHILALSADMTREDGQVVKAGRYVVDDLNAAEMMVIADRGTVQLWPFTELNRAQREDPEAKAILIIHPGGFGDQMMLGPAIRAHKRKHPDITIAVCCRERHRVVFENLTYPDRFVDYPLELTEITGEYRRIILTENMNEATEEGRTLHAVDSKAKRLGVELEGDTKVELNLTAVEREDAARMFPRLVYEGRVEKVQRPRVGIQVAASAANRTYSAMPMSNVIHSLYMEEWEIMIFGTPGSTAKLFERVDPKVMIEVRKRLHDCAAMGLAFRQSAAVAETCDVLFTPDSAMMHVAGALEIPCVAVFGPIDYKLRTAYYPSVYALHGGFDPATNEGCALSPCFFHQRGGLLFPKNGPCNTSQRCNALDSIKSSEIGRRLNQLRRKPAPA